MCTCLGLKVPSQCRCPGPGCHTGREGGLKCRPRALTRLLQYSRLAPASAHLSAIALQPLLKKYDERMQKHGGFVRSIADDVYLVGPPSAVAEVYPDYKEDLKGIGSRLNEPKNAVLLGPECELPAEFPIRRGAIYDGPMGKSGNLVGYGIVCVGVPIGDASFIRRYLELKETDVIEKFDRTMELLGPTSKFTAFRLTQQCLAPRGSSPALTKRYKTRWLNVPHRDESGPVGTRPTFRKRAGP